MKRRTKVIVILSCFAVVIAALLILPGVVVYEEFGFICENTGSTKGYRTYFFGLQQGKWEETSALEKFMAQKYPSELRHRWTQYGGTGYNIFGKPMSYSHGRPGAIIDAHSDRFQQWVSTLNDAEKKSLYDLFVSDNQAEINRRVATAVESIAQ